LLEGREKSRVHGAIRFGFASLCVFPSFAQAAFSSIGVIVCVFCNGKALVVVLRH